MNSFELKLQFWEIWKLLLTLFSNISLLNNTPAGHYQGYFCQYLAKGTFTKGDRYLFLPRSSFLALPSSLFLLPIIFPYRSS